MNQRSATMAIRIWTDTGEPPLRARLISTDDLDGTGVEVVYVSGEAEVADAVTRWLERFWQRPDEPAAAAPTMRPEPSGPPADATRAARAQRPDGPR